MAWVGWVMGRRDHLAVEVDADDGVELLLGQRVPGLAPGPVRIMLTVHCPLLSWALADLTSVPVSLGRARARSGRSPSAAVPGRSTVAFLLSLSAEVDG